ncbi:MAG: hypothetical protein ACRD0P_18225, partial [Stackebrandtia sp.]
FAPFIATSLGEKISVGLPYYLGAVCCVVAVVVLVTRRHHLQTLDEVDIDREPRDDVPRTGRAVAEA